MIRPRSLNVEAKLACHLDGHPVSVQIADARIRVDFQDAGTGFRLLKIVSSRGLGASRNSWRGRVQGVEDWLVETGLALEVRLRSRPVVTVNCGGRPSLWKLAGLAHLTLHPVNMLFAMAPGRGQRKSSKG